MGKHDDEQEQGAAHAHNMVLEASAPKQSSAGYTCTGVFVKIKTIWQTIIAHRYISESMFCLMKAFRERSSSKARGGDTRKPRHVGNISDEALT